MINGCGGSAGTRHGFALLAAACVLLGSCAPLQGPNTRNGIPEVSRPEGPGETRGEAESVFILLEGPPEARAAAAREMVDHVQRHAQMDLPVRELGEATAILFPRDRTPDSAPPFLQLSVTREMRRQSAPRLLISDEELRTLRGKAGTDPRYGEALAALRHDARQALARINSGSESPGFPHGAGWMRDMALYHAVTGEEPYALALQAAFKRWTESPLRFEGSSLAVSGHLIPAAWAYDLFSRELEDTQRESVKSLLRQGAEWVRERPRGGMNWQMRINAAVGLTGFAIGEPELYLTALFGDGRGIRNLVNGGPPSRMDQYNAGLLEHIGSSLHGDGMHFEQSMAYHYLALQYMALLAEAAFRNGYDLFDAPVGGQTLRMAFQAPLYHVFPGGHHPMFADTNDEHLVSPWLAWLYAIAAKHYGDPAHQWLWERNPPRLGRDQRMPRLLALLAADSAGMEAAPGPPAAGSGSFAPLGVNHLGNTLLGGVGMGILRARQERGGLSVAAIYKPHGVLANHQRADNLAVEISGNPHRWMPGTGNIAPYGTVLHQAFAVQTLAANTLVVDGVSQSPQGEATDLRHTRDSAHRSSGRLDAFASGPLFSFMRISSDQVYEGVRIERHLLHAGDYLLDLVAAESDRVRTFDLVGRIQGNLQERTFGLLPVEQPLVGPAGYDFLEQTQRVDADGDWSSVWKSESAEESFHMLALHEHGTVNYLATAPWRNERRIPMFLRRRRAKDAFFVQIYEEFADFPAVISATADRGPGGSSQTIRIKGRTFSDLIHWHSGTEALHTGGVRHQGRLLALRREEEKIRGGLVAEGRFLSTGAFTLRLEEGVADMGWMNLADGSCLITLSSRVSLPMVFEMVLEETQGARQLYLVESSGILSSRVEAGEGPATLTLEGGGPLILAILPPDMKREDWTAPRLTTHLLE